VKPLIFIIGIAFGLIGGKALNEIEWRRNAHNPQRLLRGGIFYKVVLVDYLKSWDLAHVHFDFPDVTREKSDQKCNTARVP